MVSEYKNKKDTLENKLSINLNIMLIWKIFDVKIEIHINNFVIILCMILLFLVCYDILILIERRSLNKILMRLTFKKITP